MAREMCTFNWQDKSVKCKWQDKSVRLNGKEQSVRLNGKTTVYVLMERQKCTSKLQLYTYLDGKTKVYV